MAIRYESIAKLFAELDRLKIPYVADVNDKGQWELRQGGKPWVLSQITNITKGKNAVIAGLGDRLLVAECGQKIREVIVRCN